MTSTWTAWQVGDPLSPTLLNAKDQALLNSTFSNVDITGLNSQMTAVLSQVTVLNSSVTNLNSQVTALLSSVTILNSAVTKLNSDVTTLNSKVTALESGMTLNNTSITSLNSLLSGAGSGWSSVKFDYLGSLVSASQTLNFGSGLTLSLVTGVPTVTATGGGGGGSGFTLQSNGSTLASTNTVNFTGFSITSVAGVMTIPAPSGSASSIPGHIAAADLAALSFFQQNSATLSLDTPAGVGTYLLPPVGSNQISSADHTLSAPTSDWVHRGRFWLPATDLAGWAAGLTIRESGSGKMVTLFIVRSGGAPTYGLQIWRWTAFNNFSTTIATVDLTTFLQMLGSFTLEITKSGNTLHYGYNMGT